MPASLREYFDPRLGRWIQPPRIARPPGQHPWSAGDLRGPIGPLHDGPDEHSGSYPERVLDELVKHHDRDWSSIAVLPTSQSYDRGEIAVIEDDGTILMPNGTNVEVDPANLCRRFIELHQDEYDYINLWVASNITNLSMAGFAYELNVRSDVEGIGLQLYDLSDDFGSNGVLKSFLHMNRLSRYPASPDSTFLRTNTAMDVLGQEAGHRFGAFLYFDDGGVVSSGLLGRSASHWSFFYNSLASDLEGNRWRDNGDGTFTTIDATSGFSYLDEYLFGLRDSSEVDTLWYIENPTNFNPPGTFTPSTAPRIGVTTSGTQRFVDISQITAVHGLRTPGPSTSQHTFRMAWVLLIRNGDVPTAEDLAKIDLFRTTWETYFRSAVNDLGSMDTHLNSVAGDVVIEHAPLEDTENTTEPRTATAQMFIRQKSLLIGFDASSPRLHWRANGGSYTSTAMTPQGGDLYAAQIPAQPSGTTVEYYLSASSDSAGIDAVLPVNAPSIPFDYFVGPDLDPPTLAHLPPPHPAVIQLPVPVKVAFSDNLGMDSVLVEWQVDGGTLQVASHAPTGDGDFTFGVGAGAAFGDIVTYRFRAVDRAVAKNRAVLPADGTPFVLVVGNDYSESLENSDGGYTHSVVTTGHIDQWHDSTQRNHTPGGGRSWKCGNQGPGSYAARLHAGLVSAPFAVGTNGWLRFHHFYDMEIADTPETAYDGGLVEISTDGGASWSTITPVGGYPALIVSSNPFPPGARGYAGTTADFVQAEFDLAAFAGTTARVRWSAGSDGFVGGEGWYVDDITVTSDGGTPTAVSVHPEPSFALEPALPNPASSRTTIRWRLPAPEALRLRVYDARGRLVRTLVDGLRPAGPGAITWDGRDEDGRQVPSGLYFYGLKADSGERSGRLAWIR